MKNNSVAEKFEYCIICGKLTYVPISMPIDWRENYEIGLGQVCAVCAKKQRNAAQHKNILTYKQVLLAVKRSSKEIN